MDLQSVDTLSSIFGMHHFVSFRASAEGLCFVDIQTDLAQASIALQGAHIVHWQPAKQQPVLWLSENSALQPGVAIRGGIPICWPWFGPHVSESHFPSHGIARTASWALESILQRQQGEVELCFTLPFNESMHRRWPYAVQLSLQIVVGTTLSVELITNNTGLRDFCITEALHAYLQISDIQKVAVLGLDQCKYIDKLDAQQVKTQVGAVQLTEETDRVYLDTQQTCVIEDPGLQRQIKIEKWGSDSTVVWNPWQAKSSAMADMTEQGFRSMVCVEAANAASNQLRVSAGDGHKLSVRYSLA